jgi:thiol-disulfide isomerase/thioredoxin
MSGDLKMIWTCLIASGCLAAMVAVYRALLVFRDEVDRLPRAGHSNGVPHALLGASLKVAVDLPAHVQGRAAVVQFAAPGCPKCHDELRVLERAYKDQPFPYVCLYEDGEQDDPYVREFLAEFGHLNLVPLTRETMQKLGVEVTPIVMMIDADAVVRRVEFRLPQLLAAMPVVERRAS